MSHEQGIRYFRTVNLGTMIRHHHSAKQVGRFLARMGIPRNGRDPYDTEEFVTLEVSRADIWKNTTDTLWGQEKRLLMKPLKIIMGRERGELGQDGGGITSEFFRVVLKEVFQADFGECIPLCIPLYILCLPRYCFLPTFYILGGV